MQIQLPKESEGLILRSFTHEDAKQLAEIEFDTIVKKYLALPQKEKPQWLQEFNPDTYNGYAVVINGVLAGRASIWKGEQRGTGEFSIVIGRPFLGLKLGRKVATMLIQAAFDELKAKALIAKVHPKHRASIALLEEFRFCLYDSVDTSTAHSWQKDHLIYRLSEDDYKAMPL